MREDKLEGKCFSNLPRFSSYAVNVGIVKNLPLASACNILSYLTEKLNIFLLVVSETC